MGNLIHLPISFSHTIGLNAFISALEEPRIPACHPKYLLYFNFFTSHALLRHASAYPLRLAPLRLRLASAQWTAGAV